MASILACTSVQLSAITLPNFLVLQTRTRLSAAKIRLRDCQTSTAAIAAATFSSQPSQPQQHAAGAQSSPTDWSQVSSLPLRPRPRASNVPFVHQDHVSKDTSASIRPSSLHSVGVEDDTSSMCVVCLDSEPQIIFKPCLHMVACCACAARIAAKSNDCPLCRCFISATQLL